MANIIHSLPYPALENGNLSFPEGRYAPSVHPISGTSVKIIHILENAGLIKKLIEDKKAKYGCLLSVPLTGHRSLNLSEEENQTIEWNIDILGEPPILRPIIVAVDAVKHTFSSSDDVADLWVGKEITIPKGARLARGEYIRSVSSLQSLLRIQKDDQLSDGCFFVVSNENDGFTFLVNVAADLHDRFSELDEALYRSICVHMVSMCFVVLKNEQGIEDDYRKKWEEHSNLKMLSEFLEKQGLLHWTHGGFHPDKTAMQLYPLILPQKTDEE